MTYAPRSSIEAEAAAEYREERERRETSTGRHAAPFGPGGVKARDDGFGERKFRPKTPAKNSNVETTAVSKPPAPGDERQVVKVNGVDKILTTVEALNERFAIFEPRGGTSVYVSRIDFHPIADIDLKRRLENEVVCIGEDSNGRPIHTKAFAAFTGNADRRVYREAVFTNHPIKPAQINLFPGLGVTPTPGKCSRILQHITEVICGGDPIASDAMLKLLAWQLQNIGRPSRIIVVLKSAQQQVGKGVLLGEVMTPIYGPSAFAAATTDQILGRFNSAIRGRAFVFLDEVLFAGDRKAEKWLEECASTERIIGLKLPDADGWRAWIEGEQLTFAALSQAYTEWQKTVKSPVAPRPTPIGNLGEILKRTGLEVRRTNKANLQVLPSAAFAL